MTQPALSLVYNAAPLSGGAGNMSLDPDTGELLVTPGFTAQTSVYLLNRDGSTIQTVGTGFYTRYGTYKQLLTGDIYSGSCCGKAGGGSGAALVKLAAGTTVATTLFDNATVRGGYSPWPDRASAATQRLVIATWRDTGSAADGLWFVDLATTTMQQLAPISTGNTFKAVHVFGRNLQTVSIGQGQWAARLSFPGQTGQSYVLALSLSGYRPAFPLPDRPAHPARDRQLHGAQPDHRAGSILLQQHRHAQRECRGGWRRSTLRLLGKAANGLVFYLLPAVLDSRAPFGISIIGRPQTAGDRRPVTERSSPGTGNTEAGNRGQHDADDAAEQASVPRSLFPVPCS